MSYIHMIIPARVEAVLGKQKALGYTLAVLGALAAALYFIPYKKGVETISPDVFTLGLFLVSLIFQGIPFSVKRKMINFSKPLVISSLIIAILSVVGNYACGKALENLNPPVTVVIIRTQVLFVMFMGWMLYGEKVNRFLWIGGVFSLFGIVLSGYSEQGWKIYRWIGVLWALGSMAGFAMMHVFIKSQVKRLDPASLNMIRIFFSALMLILIPGRAGSLFSLSLFEWGLITASAVFGPIFSRLLNMEALKYIPVSRFILFSLLTPVFASLLSWLLLGDVPSIYETIGGVVVIIGIGIPLFASVLVKRKIAQSG